MLTVRELKVPAGVGQMIETRRFLFAEVAEIYRVPKSQIRPIASATFQNQTRGDPLTWGRV